MKDGRYAVLLLNRDATASKEITLNWSDLGLKGSKTVKEVYGAKSLGAHKDKFSKSVPARSSVFVVL
ncbi:hypothetical protein [Botryobacter ruber]|uniref:hypothetical protein n=1 Tax=Botryobacter ruber TaxID=2171629 RepID=UPI00374465CA